jgi:cytochrome c-type biogenesis protein CcmH/NrfG
MFTQPVFVFFVFLACLGLLYCLNTISSVLQSNSQKSAALVIALAIISIFLYFNYEAVSNYTESQVASNEQMIDSAEKLEGFLLDNPDDMRVIKALGSHYMKSGRLELAYEKFLSGYRIQGEERDFEINLGLIESTLMVRPTDFPYDIDQLIEETLVMNPENTQILWLSGLIAMGRGDTELTIERWSGLVNNPEVSLEIQNSISTQLEQLKKMEEGISILNDQ